MKNQASQVNEESQASKASQVNKNDRFDAIMPALQFINPFLPTGGAVWAQFWRNQEKILDSMEAFADGWFERRYVGTMKAREAAKRSSESESVIDVAQEIQQWAFGSMQRVVEDCLACQCHLMTALAQAAPALAQADDAAQPDQAADGETGKRSASIPAQAA
jgi:hypothetical protein